MMSVTQKEIADKLDISQSLVARALKGETRVAQETRDKVARVAQEMGYHFRSNQSARLMAARRHERRACTGVIAVTFSPKDDCPSPRRLPFFVPFLEGVENEAVKQNMEVYFCLARPESMPRLIREGVADGVISLSAEVDELAAMRELGTPVVVYQAKYPNAHSVRPDDFQGAYLATRHLLELGHRSIAFVGVQFNAHYINSACPERLQGYKKALAEFNVPFRKEWVEISLPFPNPGQGGIIDKNARCAASLGWQYLMSKSGRAKGEAPPFTAVVCYNDMIAMGLMTAAAKDGVQVPENLSVTGFDDVSTEYDFTPKITSITSDRYEAGRYAMRVLHEVTGKSGSHNGATEIEHLQHRIFPVSLSIRNSSAAPHPLPTNV